MYFTQVFILHSNNDKFSLITAIIMYEKETVYKKYYITFYLKNLALREKNYNFLVHISVNAIYNINLI